MKRFTSLILASILIIGLSTSAFAATVFGMGEIVVGDTIVEILLDENLSPDKGCLIYSDYSTDKLIDGEINSVTVNSSSKVSFSGTFEAEDGTIHTFNAVAEDLGITDGTDKFSVTDSLGYSKSGTLVRGQIEIVQ